VFREEEVTGVMLTRFSAWPSSAARVADLRRVEYRLREGRLWRREWDALDRIASTSYRERPLPLELGSFSLRFLGASGWQEDWPRGAAAGVRDTLPRAVMVTLGLADGRSLIRLFRVGGLRP
jgi:type II secretion system protein J